MKETMKQAGRKTGNGRKRTVEKNPRARKRTPDEASPRTTESPKGKPAAKATRNEKEAPVCREKPAKKRTKQRSSGAGRMNDGLLKKCNEIRDLLAAADTQDVRNRYKIAVACRDVRDNSAYGSGAVAKLAAELDWSERKIRYYADVAEAWPDQKQFDTLVEKKGKRGLPLSWWHFVELTQEENSDSREHLRKRALDEGWSVDELAAARKAESVESESPDSVDCIEVSASVPQSPSVLVMENVRTEVDTLKSNTGLWEKTLSKTIKVAEPRVLEGLLAELHELQSDYALACQAGTEVFEQGIFQLEERLKLEKRKRQAAKKQAADPFGGNVGD